MKFLHNGIEINGKVIKGFWEYSIPLETIKFFCKEDYALREYRGILDTCYDKVALFKRGSRFFSEAHTAWKEQCMRKHNYRVRKLRKHLCETYGAGDFLSSEEVHALAKKFYIPVLNVYSVVEKLGLWK